MAIRKLCGEWAAIAPCSSPSQALMLQRYQPQSGWFTQEYFCRHPLPLLPGDRGIPTPLKP